MEISYFKLLENISVIHIYFSVLEAYSNIQRANKFRKYSELFQDNYLFIHLFIRELNLLSIFLHSEKNSRKVFDARMYNTITAIYLMI